MLSSPCTATDCSPRTLDEGERGKIPCPCEESLELVGLHRNAHASLPLLNGDVTCDMSVAWYLDTAEYVGKCDITGVYMEEEFVDIMTIEEDRGLVINEVKLSNNDVYRCRVIFDYYTELIVHGKFIDLLRLERQYPLH